jgi:hypothetical protein
MEQKNVYSKNGKIEGSSKLPWKYIVPVLFACFPCIVQAQLPNVALSATASASFTDLGQYNASRWNDGVIGGDFFGWVGTASNFPQPPWIQLEWQQPQTFTQVTIVNPTGLQLPPTGNAVVFEGTADLQFWNGATWVTIRNFAASPNSPSFSISFSAITTTRLRIANMNITGDENPAFDEIQVRNTNLPECLVRSITQPAGDAADSPQNITVRLVNTGVQTLTAIPLSFSVDGQVIATEEITTSLATNDSTDYTFDASWNPTESGDATICVAIAIPDDPNRDNDTTCKTVNYQAPESDGGIIRITKPASSSDEGSVHNVTVIIRNFGDAPIANFDIGYSVNGEIASAETFVGTIAPKDSAEFVFPNHWLLDTPGDFQVCAYTFVSNDANAANDTNCAVITVKATATVGDIGISAIRSPKTSSSQESQPIELTITNYSQLEVSQFNIAYSVNGGSASIEPCPLTLAPGGSADYTLVNRWKPFQDGEYEICAYTILPNDSDAENDDFCTDVTIDATSVEEQVDRFHGTSMKVFPQPASDVCSLVLPHNVLGTVHCSLYSMEGMLMQEWEEELSTKNQPIAVDVQPLATGVYIVQCRTRTTMFASMLTIRK